MRRALVGKHVKSIVNDFNKHGRVLSMFLNRKGEEGGLHSDAVEKAHNGLCPMRHNVGAGHIIPLPSHIGWQVYAEQNTLHPHMKV